MTRLAYSIEADQEQLRSAQALLEFIGGNTDEATRIAINRTGKQVRTLSSRKIREQVNLKASYVKGRLSFVGAKRGKLEGRITARSRGILLSRYSTNAQVRGNGEKFSLLSAPKAPPRGIRVKVKAGGSPKTVEGKPGEIQGKPFFIILPNSRALAIAGRRRNLGKRGGKIKVFYAPSVSQVFNSVRDEVLPEAGDIFTKEMGSAIRFLISKRLPRE